MLLQLEKGRKALLYMKRYLRAESKYLNVEFQKISNENAIVVKESHKAAADSCN